MCTLKLCAQSVEKTFEEKSLVIITNLEMWQKAKNCPSVSFNFFNLNAVSKGIIIIFEFINIVPV
jgi:hypothetical protein